MTDLPTMPSGYYLKQGYDEFTIFDSRDALIIVYKNGYANLPWSVEWLDDRMHTFAYETHIKALKAVVQTLTGQED